MAERKAWRAAGAGGEGECTPATEKSVTRRNRFLETRQPSMSRLAGDAGSSDGCPGGMRFSRRTVNTG
jgi:hypothetical protein